MSGAVLTSPPKKISLTFSEKVEQMMTHFYLLRSNGDTIRVGSLDVSSESAHTLEAEILDSLPSGKYSVKWMAAGSDGHGTHGTFTFSVATTGPPDNPMSQPGAMIDKPPASMATQGGMDKPDDKDADSGGVLAAIARTVSFIGVLLLVGVIGFKFLVLSQSGLESGLRESAAKKAISIGVWAAIAVLAALSVRIFLESKMMSAMGGEPFSSRRVLMDTQWGAAIQIEIIATVIAAGSLLLSARIGRAAWIVAGLGAVGATIGVALSGHAAASDRYRAAAISVDVIHLLAGGCWLGSLFLVTFAGLPTAWTEEGEARWRNVAGLVNAFSPVALIATAVIVLTGSFSAWIQLEHLQNLWQTDYGKVLLIKIALFGGTAAIGAYNFLAVKPELLRAVGSARIAKSARAELLVGVLILIATGLLTGLSAH